MIGQEVVKLEPNPGHRQADDSGDKLGNIIVSVIIPTYNRAEYLDRCLRSINDVIKNDYSDIEIIVVDGGSTDGTSDVIKKYSDEKLVYISEPDEGAADAINKGIKIARGEIIRYFSDDDEMIPGENAFFVEYLVEHPDIDVVAGHAKHFRVDKAGKVTPIFPNQFIGEITKDNFCSRPVLINHEAVFFRKTMFNNLGGYDVTYKYCFDVELWFRILLSGRKIVISDKVIVNRFLQPSSNSQTHDTDNFKEFKRIFLKYRLWKTLVNFYWHWKWKEKIDSVAIHMKKIVKWPIKRIREKFRPLL